MYLLCTEPSESDSHLPDFFLLNLRFLIVLIAMLASDELLLLKLPTTIFYTELKLLQCIKVNVAM